MLTNLLICMVETHMIYRKIALFHLYSMIYSITVRYKEQYGDMTLKTAFQNFYIQFLNSDFSFNNALNETKFLGVSQNFDLAPG